MTVYLWNLVLDGTLPEDEWETDSEYTGDWITRCRKRVIWGDGLGRVWSYRHSSVSVAQEDLDNWLRDHPHIQFESEEDF